MLLHHHTSDELKTGGFTAYHAQLVDDAKHSRHCYQNAFMYYLVLRF